MKKKTIRIPCAVDHTGNWSACAWEGGDDALMWEATEGAELHGTIQRFYIEVEIPVPEDGVVPKGVVKE